MNDFHKQYGDIISLADKVGKIGFGKDTQLAAISDNEEHKYTVNLSKYGFTTPPIVILALRRAGYTGTAFYQLNNVNVSSFEYVIRLSDIHNIASAFINWIAIGE